MSLRIGKFPDNKGGSCLQDIVIEVNNILEGGTGGGGGSVNIPDEIITDISVDPNSTNTTQVGLEIIKDKSGVEETTQIYIESASDTKAGVMSSDDKIELGELRTDLTQTQTDLDNVELSVDELQDDVEALENKMTTVESTLTEVENSTLNYDSATKKIQLLQGGDVVSEIDAARFVKDGIVDSVTLNQDTKSVTITFNVDAGKEDITVDFSDIYDVLLTEAKNYVNNKLVVIEPNITIDNEKLFNKIGLNTLCYIKDGSNYYPSYKQINIDSIKLYYDSNFTNSGDNSEIGRTVRQIILQKTNNACTINDVSGTIVNWYSKNKIDSIIGTNAYTNANYISKETNLTDAALQLDEEIKATNDNLAILNAATIKGVKVGNNTTNESVTSGIVTIANADSTKDGTISKRLYNTLDTYDVLTSGLNFSRITSDNNALALTFYYRKLLDYNTPSKSFQIQFPEATIGQNGIMSSSDKIKLNSIINTGDGTKFLANDFTYKTIQMPDLSTYATKSELSSYLPLSGGEMTGNLSVPQVNNLSVIRFSPNMNPGAAVHITANNGILTFFSNKDDNNGTILFMGNKIQTSIVPEVVSGSEFLPLYYSGNFQAGVDYVAPSALDGYLPLSGGTITDDLTVNGIATTSELILADETAFTVNLTGYAKTLKTSATKLSFSDVTVIERDDQYLRLGNIEGNDTTIEEIEFYTNSLVRWGTDSSQLDPYEIYDSGNFIAGTNYLAPEGVTVADINNLGNNWSSILTGSVQSKNFTVNGTGRSVFGPSTETFSIYAPDNAGTSGQFLKSTGSTPSWGNIAIADVSGLQDSLDGKAGLTGDSFKNNNACWGGTRPDGTQTCLVWIDTNGNNKFGNCYGGTYLRASTPQTLFLEIGTPGSMDDSVFYQIYNEGNFVAGTNYVAPSTLNNYLPLSGGTLTGSLIIGSLSGDNYKYIRILRNNYRAEITNSSNILQLVMTEVGSDGSSDVASSRLQLSTSDLTFNDNHVLTEADTFNTITYTTSASEDNLRAWNNYVNGYVTNLQLTGDSNLLSQIKIQSEAVRINDREIYFLTINASSNLLEYRIYTIAENGSVTKSQTNYTLTPTT